MKPNIRSMTTGALVWEGVKVTFTGIFYVAAIFLLFPFVILAVACFGSSASAMLIEPVERYTDLMNRLAGELERRNEEIRDSIP